MPTFNLKTLHVFNHIVWLLSPGVITIYPFFKFKLDKSNDSRKIKKITSIKLIKCLEI